MKIIVVPQPWQHYTLSAFYNYGLVIHLMLIGILFCVLFTFCEVPVQYVCLFSNTELLFVNNLKEVFLCNPYITYPYLTYIFRYVLWISCSLLMLYFN